MSKAVNTKGKEPKFLEKSGSSRLSEESPATQNPVPIKILPPQVE